MTDIERTFLDTNIFIYALEKRYSDVMKVLEDAIASDSAVTSTISIMEYCTGAYRISGEKGIDVFKNFMKENYIKVRSIDSDVSLTAAKIRAENKAVKGMDALQLAAAIESGCKVFYTNDLRLGKVKGVDIEIKTLKNLS